MRTNKSLYGLLLHVGQDMLFTEFLYLFCRQHQGMDIVMVGTICVGDTSVAVFYLLILLQSFPRSDYTASCLTAVVILQCPKEKSLL